MFYRKKFCLNQKYLDLKANPDRLARGAIIESELDKGRGIKCNGSCAERNNENRRPVYCGSFSWVEFVQCLMKEEIRFLKLLHLHRYRFLDLKAAPQAGDTFVVVESERDGA